MATTGSWWALRCCWSMTWRPLRTSYRTLFCRCTGAGPGSRHRGHRGGVPRQGGGGDRLAVDRPTRRRQPAERGVGFALREAGPLAPKRVARGKGLDAAVVWAVALAPRPVALDDHVAKLGAGAGRASVHVAVDDEAAADPRADRQQDGVPCPAGGAEAVLGERRGVGVVVDEGR